MMWQISQSPSAFAGAARALGRDENDDDDQRPRCTEHHGAAWRHAME